MTGPPLFPGSTAVSHVQVYEWETGDELHGGSPHMHTVSTEAYVVTAGRGEVHTISAAGPAQDTLAPGTVLWFSPGTVHRLINHDHLELLAIMQNSGLPEAGDAVLTFPRRILRDPDAYAAAAALPADGSDVERAGAARTRRDLAIAGYRDLLRATQTRGPAALEEYQALAAAIVQPKVDAWTRLWRDTVEAETSRTHSHLAALADADPAHLGWATVVRTMPTAGPRAYGMCGRLKTWTVQQT